MQNLPPDLNFSRRLDLFELRDGEWYPVPGTETDGADWVKAQLRTLKKGTKAAQAALQRAKNRQATLERAVADGSPTAIMRVMAVGETRVLGAYRNPSQISSIVCRMQDVLTAQFEVAKDKTFGCLTIKRTK